MMTTCIYIQDAERNQSSQKRKKVTMIITTHISHWCSFFTTMHHHPKPRPPSLESLSRHRLNLGTSPRFPKIGQRRVDIKLENKKGTPTIVDYILIPCRNQGRRGEEQCVGWNKKGNICRNNTQHGQTP